MTRTLTYLAIALVGTFAFTAAAFAGCNPKCPKGQQCRYEAAGGKFYCESLSKAKLTPAGAKVAPGRSPSGAKAPSKTSTRR